MVASMKISVNAITAYNVSSTHWVRLFRRAALFSVNTVYTVMYKDVLQIAGRVLVYGLMV